MNHFSNNLGSNDFNMLDNDMSSLSLPTIDNSFEPTNPLGDNSNNIDLSPPVQFTPQPINNQTDVNTSVNISNTLNNDSVFSFDNNIDMYNTVNCNLNNFNGRNENGINRLQQSQQQNGFSYPLSLQQQQQMQQRQLYQQQQQQQQQFFNNNINNINSINSGWNSNSMVQQYPMMNMTNNMLNSNYNGVNMNPTNLFDNNTTTFNTRNNITQGINNISLNSTNPSLLNNFMVRNNNQNNTLVPPNNHFTNQNDNGSQITTSETSVDIDFDIKNEQSSIIDYSTPPIQQIQQQQHSMSIDTSEQNLSISNGVTNQSNIVTHTRSKRPLKRKQVPIDGRIDSRNKKLKTNNYQSRSVNKSNKTKKSTKKKDVKTIPDDKLNININDAQLSIFGIAISFIVVYNKKLPAIYLEEALKNIAKYCWNIHNTSLMECEISTEDEVPEPLKPKKPKKGRPPKEDKNSKKINSSNKDIICVNKSFKYHAKKEAWNRLSCVINIQDLLQDNEFIKSCNLQDISSNKELREKIKEDIIENIEGDLRNKSNLTKLLRHVLQPFDIRIENKIVYQKMVCVREIDATKLEEVAEKEKKRRTDKTIRERKRRANKTDKKPKSKRTTRSKKKTAVAVC